MFSRSDIPVIQKRVFPWINVYYETMADIIRKYSHAEDIFPDHLLPHTRQALLIVTPKIFMFSVYNSGEPWKVEWRESIDNEVLQGAPDAINLKRFVNQAQRSREYNEFRIRSFSIENKEEPSGSTLPKWANWEQLVVSDTSIAKRWTADEARRVAHSDVLTITIARLFGKPHGGTGTTGIHAEPHEAVAKELRDLIREFEVLLNDANREEDVQLFIKEHPYLLDLRAIAVDSKVPLGSEYVTDFIVSLPGSQYLLVELERASHMLYTKANNPTAALTHAVSQVEDWLEWSYENLSYLRGRYPDIHEPRGLVILGRRSSLNHKAAKALRRRNVLSKVQVATYDDLIDDMKAIATNLERGTIPTSSSIARN
jgi:hypothetical protein